MDAARSANIHTFVTSLPGGYETKVSAKYDIKTKPNTHLFSSCKVLEILLLYVHP